MSAKDIDFLIRAIHEQSKGAFKVVNSGGSKHRKVIHAEGPKKGRGVIDQNGPLIVSGTPGDYRFRDMHVKRLTAAGVLKFDPWNPPQGKPSHNGAEPEPATPFEAREARRQAVASAARKMNSASDELRERVEPMLVKIGGSWTKRGFTQEFGETAFHFLELHDIKPRWPSKEAAVQSARTLGKGNSLSLAAVEAWSAFITDLEGAAHPADYYMQLVRLARGVPALPRSAREPIATRSDDMGTARAVQLPEVKVIETKPSAFDFVNLAQLHERTGLKWSMGLDIDEYAELQRATGFLEAVIVRDYGERGEKALNTFANFLIKMAEARFYSMAGRDEAKDE